MTEEIKKLTDSQHIRHRTEMYLGSRNPHTQTIINWDGKKLIPQESIWIPALYNAFREILDNALDEVVSHGFGSKIDITYDEPTMSFSVKDDGRGIPIDWDDSEKMHKATMVLIYPRAGRNFGERLEVRGTNGVGASATVHCSKISQVTIVRDGKKFYQKFEEPNAVFSELQISNPIITKNTTAHTGTLIEFTLSNEVFKKFVLPTYFVKSRIFEVAASNPKIKFTFNGEKINIVKNTAKTLFGDQNLIEVEIKQDKFLSNYYLIPNFAESGEYLHSTVNDIPAFNGGQHIDTFKKLFFGGLLKALERENKKRGLIINRSDISEGLLIYNITKMNSPNFDSQSKTRLINDEVDVYIKSTLDNENIFKDLIKKNKEWIDQIYERCAARTQKKDEKDLAKVNRKLMRTKVPKLLDANGKDRTKCILIISEGDSAAGQISSVRDPEIHGALPLRGKILNVNGESPKDIVDNAIISDLMTTIGVAIGRKATRANLRYGKVYLAADQDPDGANITALLVNFFYLQWPELFDPKLEPFFYAFATPFIIQESGKKRHYWYSHNVHEYNINDWKGCPKATRAKGLGSLEEIDWIYSLANPMLTPLVDDGKLNDSLDLIFNHAKADMRKDWISLNTK